MDSLTLKQLRYFDALARQGHFGRAAALCGVSQPALSVQIRALEAQIGTPLVERGTKQIRLTAFGEAFRDRARDILARVEQLDNLVRSAIGPLAGRLRLGVIPTVAPYLLPRVVGALARDLPELDVLPKEAITRQLIADLQDSRLDAAIVALPVSEPEMEEMALFSEAFLLLRPASEADTPIPAPEDLRHLKLLLLAEGHCFRDQALSFCEIGQSERRTLMEGSSLSTLAQMVGAGMGITLIPEMAVPLETRRAPVVAARFESAEPSRQIGMIWRKAHPLADQFARVAKVIGALSPTQGA